MVLPRFLSVCYFIVCLVLIIQSFYFINFFMKNYTEDILIFRLIDSHWKCSDPHAYSGTLADFLALLGIDFLPDSLEYAGLHIQDDFYIQVFQDAISVKFKLFNKPSNFLQNDQNS